MNNKLIKSDITICHITSAHPRYDKRIFVKEATSLAEKGYKVTLIVQDSQPKESLQGVTIKSTKYQPKNRIDRLLSTRKLLRIAIETKADIYQIHDPDLLFLGVKLTRMGRSVVYDCHESYDTYTYPYIPLNFGRVLAKVYGYLERKIVPRFSGVATVNDELVKKFQPLNKNVVKVSNFPVLKNVEILEKVEKDKFSLCYAGGISSGWNIDKIISALPFIDKSSLKLAGFGDDVFLSKIKAMEGWSKVKFVGKIPHNEVFHFMMSSCIGIALLNYSETDNEYVGGTLGNTKLFEYMRAGIPVIATDFPNWKNVVEKNECGICVNPNDENALIQAIQYLFSHPNLAEDMGQNGRKAVEQYYNWDSQLVNLESLYSRILKIRN